MKFAWLLICSVLTAQDRPFRAETRVVQVPVSVTDEKGRNVEGLLAGDFVVLDEGATQTIKLDTFGTGVAPILLVIAVQTSAISTPAMAKIRRIGGMIQPLVIGRRGEVAVITFDNQIKWKLDFTNEPEQIGAAVKSLKSGSNAQSRLFDAVIDAAERLRTRPGRKVILLISETKDRGSYARLTAAVEAVEREGVEVFAAPYSASATAWIAKPEDLPPPSAPNYLAAFDELFRLAKTNDTHALTQATGGSQYPFVRERGVEKAVENVGVEVHSQYILSFPAGTGANGMHHIEVSLPNRPGLHVKARQAWFKE